MAVREWKNGCVPLGTGPEAGPEYEPPDDLCPPVEFVFHRFYMLPKQELRLSVQVMSPLWRTFHSQCEKSHPEKDPE